MCSGEKLYQIVADNIRRERKKLGLSQAALAEKADISIDTVRSVENGRRSMSLETYLRIVQALETTPSALLLENGNKCYTDRFHHITDSRSEREVEFVLHLVEEILKGKDSYLCR